MTLNSKCPVPCLFSAPPRLQGANVFNGRIHHGDTKTRRRNSLIQGAFPAFIFVIGFLFIPLLLGGCAATAPQLVARKIPHVPEPNAIVENSVWRECIPLDLVLDPPPGKVEGRSIQLRAVHDGRALSIMASWPDYSGLTNPGGWAAPLRGGKLKAPPMCREWVWDPEKNDYRLSQWEPDKLTFEWSIGSKRPAGLLTPRQQRLDQWQWLSGWSELCGFAEDGLVATHLYPGGERPEGVEGELFRTGGDGLIGIERHRDAGRPGVRPVKKPIVKFGSREPGLTAGETPSGSFADVRAAGFFRDSAAGGNGPGMWIVEVHRLLMTADFEDDYQFRDDGPHWFTVAIHDNSAGEERYTSGPIRFMLRN